jgi:glutamine cyclotransferase
MILREAIVRILVLVAALLLALPALAAVPVSKVEVVESYPHDNTAFTQGLVFINGSLYEGTGRNGASEVRKLDLTTGKVQQQTKLPAQHFGEGITVLEGKVYQLTWQTHLGFVYDLATLKQLKSFYLPGEGWGITHDGKQLIVSDGTASLRFFDTTTLKDGKPLDKLNELEFINGEVWANVWYSDFIVRINPESGAVVGKLDLTGLHTQRSADDVLNGIAWDADGKRLFVTGKLWSTLYQIQLPK